MKVNPKKINSINYDNLNLENISGFFPFIATQTSQDIGKVLNKERGIYMPNLNKETLVEKANDKLFLKENFSEYMVKGISIDLNSENGIKELNDFLNKEEVNGKIILRLPRSVSGLGIRFLIKDNIKKTSETDIYLNELLALTKELGQEKFLAEKLLPENSFQSPNVVGYINVEGKVDIFGVSEQLLLNKQHQGNFFNPENGFFYSELKNISKEIGEKIYKKLNVVGFLGLDFLIVDNSKLPKNTNYFNENFKGYKGNQSIALAEINFRVNGGMPLPWVQNLEQFETKNKYSTIINTEKVKKSLTGDEIINILRKNNLLLTPGNDKIKNGIVVVTILKGKLQYVIVAENKENSLKLRKKIQNLLS